MLAGGGEVDEFIKCFDDNTGKELPWQVKQAREKELKYLRQSTTSHKAFDGADANQFTTCCPSSTAGTGHACMRELPRWKL